MKDFLHWITNHFRRSPRKPTHFARTLRIIQTWDMVSSPGTSQAYMSYQFSFAERLKEILYQLKQLKIAQRKALITNLLR